MKHQTINLVKFKALGRRLHIRQYQVVGLLESVWLFAQIQAQDGDLSRFSVLEIAAWIDWEGDENALIDALVETGWLDRDGESLTVHDWQDHLPNWLKGVQARKAKQNGNSEADAGASPTTLQGESGASPEDRAGSRQESLPSPGPGSGPSQQPGFVPSTEPPNLTQPNPTQPNQKAAARAAAADLDFSPLAGTGKVKNAATELAKALGRCKLGKDREWIWRHAAVAELLHPGFIAETCDRLRSREIHKPKAYIERALREECQLAGTTLPAAIAAAPPLPELSPVG